MGDREVQGAALLCNMQVITASYSILISIKNIMCTTTAKERVNKRGLFLYVDQLDGWNRSKNCRNMRDHNPIVLPPTIYL